jgi:hypothetical protein
LQVLFHIFDFAYTELIHKINTGARYSFLKHLQLQHAYFVTGFTIEYIH